MAQEHHLRLGGKGIQGLQARLRPLVIEIDEQVVRNERYWRALLRLQFQRCNMGNRIFSTN